jgi:uncharacterized protein YggE
MRLSFVLLTIPLAAGLASAQLSTNTVTVTVSQTSSSQPDQALFSVMITSGINLGLNDVVSAVSSVGISAANLTGLAYVPNTIPQLQWDFQLTVPVSSVKTTTAELTALANKIAQTNGSLSLSFSVAGAQNSGAPAQSCDFASLMNNARAQAQSLASAAGYLAGRVLAISSTTSQGVGGCAATVKFGVGNPSTHAIEITSSRTTTSVPDQVVFGISVYSSLTSGIDDVTNALAQAGISGVSLVGVVQNSCLTSVGNACQPSLTWSFTLTAPFAALSGTLTQLLAAQAALAKQTSGITASVSIQSLQTSPQSQPACPQAALVADGTAQAQALAAAATATAGPIDGISIAMSAPTTVAIYDFLTGVPALLYVASTPQPVTCSLLVQFSLYLY